MRVSVHQSKDGDVQSVPKLPHHQPAVYIWEPFTLSPHTHSHTVMLKYMHAWYWKMLWKNVSTNGTVDNYHGSNKVSKYGQNVIYSNQTHCDHDTRTEL